MNFLIIFVLFFQPIRWEKFDTYKINDKEYSIYINKDIKVEPFDYGVIKTVYTKVEAGKINYFAMIECDCKHKELRAKAFQITKNYKLDLKDFEFFDFEGWHEMTEANTVGNKVFKRICE